MLKQTDFTFYKSQRFSTGGSVSNGLNAPLNNKTSSGAIPDPKIKIETSKGSSVGKQVPQNKNSGVITAICLTLTALVIIGGVIYITREPSSKNTNQKNNKS